MINPLLFSLLILMLKTSNVSAIYECCPNENILFLSARSCFKDSSNKSVINLECQKAKIPVHRLDFDNFGYTLLDNGTLLDDKSRDVNYCHSVDGDDANETSHIYIMCYDYTEDQFENNIFREIQAILGYISTFFIILTIIVYAMIPSLLDLQGICIMHTLVGLASGYIFLGVIQLKTDHSAHACKTYAYIIYFSLMYLFFWLAVLSFHIWRTSVKPELLNRTIKWPVIYHVFAIGGAVIALIIVLVAHYSPSPIWDAFRPGFGEQTCWFKSPREMWIYFYGPLLILLIFDITCYIWTVASLWKQVQTNRNKVLKYRLKLCVRLCIIMGITWIFEILTFIIKDHKSSIMEKIFLQFLPDLLNILQGISIFLVLVVFRKRVRRALASKNICNLKFPNAWKYLEDEEMESKEEKANGTTVEYIQDKI